ncbi:hypothetical protein [Bittarella massiliensis (ex Durand et al. 2017)]|uniref:hypothetical protein n=1 Tax=Bittarella massiliensis (ex Durand et al. 2017) TaxID=1720313 RepID=UPI001AA18BC1|nr:hypothetical protein [Bittarella massiliensis (ex Durand et al. 2017)]MBO1680459.1 hypothetical protein [Bittarella massiliensis (ex Durand et al. 2017)]
MATAAVGRPFLQKDPPRVSNQDPLRGIWAQQPFLFTSLGGKEMLLGQGRFGFLPAWLPSIRVMAGFAGQTAVAVLLI